MSPIMIVMLCDPWFSWRLVAYADALILACDNDHLLGVARRMDLLIHEVEG